ncbi:DUF2797 domain-containing protein [Ornithobacterium rhinotracheale]|uniref:DUF2797 domain-containing protein n=1 Tax=Ornithobacterium rhinotracheale TaxID=28251 RepID=A0A410JPF9_ORNRH|nr:DUF2797 domain-containing protein [Ornithobacterium rhinotracheale]QAR30063.1 DUF2797 domain-containing protein [Ornithobacterium rhinotracheale]
MIFTGALKKMLVENAQPIRYYLNLGQDFIDMNQMIGKKMHFTHIANECRGCGMDKPIFRMGFCKNCFFTHPEANPNILKPELSTAHLGIEQRNLEWEKRFELQPHVVYLALSGGLKVGVTRQVQVPTRWIDQGASQTVIFAETENRYQAGQIEVLLKNYMSDKTHWQRMLKNENPPLDLLAEKRRAQAYLPEDWAQFYSLKDEIYAFEYPLHSQLSKITSLNFQKSQEISGVLEGIKGQYLVFEGGLVFNIRAQEGYVVSLNIQ